MLLGTVYPPPQKSSQGIFLWVGPPLTPHPGKDSLGIFFLVLKKQFKENIFFPNSGSCKGSSRVE